MSSTAVSRWSHCEGEMPRRFEASMTLPIGVQQEGDMLRALRAKNFPAKCEAMDNEATTDRTQHSGEQRDDRLPSYLLRFSHRG